MGEPGYPRIARGDDGWLYVEGVGVRLVRLIADHVGGGYTAAQLVRHLPPLRLGQAHAVLAYYYDHRDAVERELAEYERRWAETVREVLAEERTAVEGRE